jgi:hypothetical protein
MRSPLSFESIDDVYLHGNGWSFTRSSLWEINPFDSPVRSFDCAQDKRPGYAVRQAFRQAQGREFIERLKAPSTAEGLRVDTERCFCSDLKIGVWRRRMYQTQIYFVSNGDGGGSNGVKGGIG